MEYKISMPVLSDTMDSGKLVKWHIKPGDHVKKGDVVAEVESDKAIMEVQSFKEGTVKELRVKEGEEVPVKSVIAVIETQESAAAKPTPPKSPEPASPPPAPAAKEPGQKAPAAKERAPLSSNPIMELLEEGQTPSAPPSIPKVEGVASAAAKRRAAELGVDIEAMQQEGKLSTPAHRAEVEALWLERYFTPRARALLEAYGIDPKSLRREGHKVDVDEVRAYIRTHLLSRAIELSSNQKAINAHIEHSARKPTYRIYDRLDLSQVPQIEGIKLTSWIVRLFADTMMEHPLTRTCFEEERLLRYESANIAIAVATETALFTPVITQAEERSITEINTLLREIKEKAKAGGFRAEDFRHSTFGISNLGMFGIEAFDALINQNDSAMAAIGGVGEQRSVRVTITFDHRILNGKDAALFVRDLKARAADTAYWKHLAKEFR